MLGVANTMFGYYYENLHPVSETIESRAADCAPSNERLFVEFNNIRALVETGGSLWQDRANTAASYEFPKGSGNHVLFSGALWMGGEDVNGQLKLAAHLFRQGNDFWAGPLNSLIPGTGNYDPFIPQSAELNLVRNSGAAEILPATCSFYDQFFTIRKSEVLQFIAWWNCENGVTDPADCGDIIRPSEDVFRRIQEWPAHGDESIGEDFYLAPFFDNALPGETGNGVYDPIADGDYPWYDIEDVVDCRNDRRVTLFGDETHWWVFNDRGNIHTETGGDPIGMEVRAQAFTFATDDEVNDMTFYNYELINRGTQTLQNTFFGQWVDPDVGFAANDLVGCDVGRGLGFCYNGDLTDAGQAGQPGYGANPPAVGVDFFEGPYQDNDGIDNAEGIADGEALNGIGYGDGVVDNERYGMQRFVFHGIGPGPYNDPNTAADFYSYLRGIWLDGLPMQFGGNGNTTGSGVPTRFMFPDDSDPLGWGTFPNALPSTDPWSELTEMNPSGDRRFLQSAGPFVLRPGAVNNITVGVVVARSTESDIEAPIRALKTADTKAQALFDNCFELVEPPLAPVMTIQELENELVLFLSDPPGPIGLENYTERDRINIITPDELLEMGIVYDDLFRFEGFQIFQMVDENASISDIGDLSKARLIAQTDIQNGVGKLVNYTFDEELNISIPEVVVEPAGAFGLDEGIRRSFVVTEDLFANGDRTLVNHRKYYYIAVSYAHNNFKTFDPNDPTALDGQRRPYLRSRASINGGIEAVVGIPHDPSPEADGRVFTTTYGFQPEITQIEGEGNGGVFLELTDETVNTILSTGKDDSPTYQSGSGPVEVKVVDPLNLQGGNYRLGFDNSESDLDDSRWWLERTFEGAIDTVWSDTSISIVREQLILEWGLSITVRQQQYEGFGVGTFTEPIGASMTFADPGKRWLTFVEDDDQFYPTNWIRSGNSSEGADHPTTPNPGCVADMWFRQPCHYDDFPLDQENSLYEQLLNGGIAPFSLVGKGPYGSPYGFPGENTATPWYESNQTWFTSAGTAQSQSRFSLLHDVDIIITNDKSLWSRCPVIEINDILDQTEHGDVILEPRGDLSVDKNGLSAGEQGYNAAEGDLVNATGMGWFPGYAIDVNTGERLNMMFSENSWLTGDNGDDMIWNPTSSFADNSFVPLFGGMHYVYVFGTDEGERPYDNGAWLREMFEVDDVASPGTRNTNFRSAWETCFWVMEPMLEENSPLLDTDVKISARINKPYEEREVNNSNEGYPLYEFSFDEPSRTADTDRLVSVLDNINVVPNPYYAYSEYETSRLDNRVKITNLPERCTVTIFNMQGALVRTFEKDDPLTSLDWDLQNHRGIPIAGGVYIIHVEVDLPDGTKEERILKWFGVLRQPDLQNL